MLTRTACPENITLLPTEPGTLRVIAPCQVLLQPPLALTGLLALLTVWVRLVQLRAVVAPSRISGR